MKHIFTISISLFIFLTGFSQAGLPTGQAGTLDKSFSGDGKAVIGFKFGTQPGDDHCFDMAIQSDGKSVLVGTSNANSTGVYDFVVARLNTDGTLDQTFNSKGYRFINFFANDEAVAVAIQSDGKIVVAGTANFDGIAKIALARLLSNGVLDPSFGSTFSGKVITDLGDSAYTNDVAIQSDGKIVVGGAYYGSSVECLLLRYNANGSLDQSFGVLGRSFTNFGFAETAHSIAIQTDGKIVIGGNVNQDYYYGSHFLIARFNSTGFLDGGFGNNGKRITRFGNTDYFSSIALQGNGKIVVVGSTNVNPDRDFVVARYNTYGTLDNTFSGDGKVLTNINNGSIDVAYDVAIQSDGKLVVAGTTVVNYNYNFVLVRYNTNGTLDNTFNGDGTTVTDFGSSGGGDDDLAYAVKIQSNGKIVTAGTRNPYLDLNSNFAIARYHGDNAAPEIFAGKSNTEDMIANEKTTSIHIFPNPVTTMLHVEGLNPTSVVTISISNLSGTVFQRATVSGSEYKLDVSVLNPGIYNLTIAGRNVTNSLKFIKQ